MGSRDRLLHYSRLIQSLLPGDRAEPIIPGTRPAHRALRDYLAAASCNSPGQFDDDLKQQITDADDSPMSSLARHVAGELLGHPAWMLRSRDSFLKLTAHQQTTGAFFPEDPKIHPESRWYDELVALHALASYSVRVPDALFRDAVARSAAFHRDEIQPDHATAEPWALLAFVQHAPTHADQLLNAISIQSPNGPTGIPLLLLRDALYGLHRLTD